MAKSGGIGRPPSPSPGSSVQQSQPATPKQSSSTSQSSSSSSAPAPPAPPGPGTIKKKAGAKAHAKSAQGDHGVQEASKQKGFLSSLTKDITREAGNIGVLGKHVAGKIGEAGAKIGEKGKDVAGKIGEKGKDVAGKIGEEGKQAAGKVGEHASALGQYAADKVKHGDIKTAEVEREFGKEVAQDFKSVKTEMKTRLPVLEEKERKSLNGKLTDANEQAELNRLRVLKQGFKEEPRAIATHLADPAVRQDPAFKWMGPTKFASYEVATRKALEANGGARLNLSTMERVSIYGYTTSDYKKLNPELRAAQGKPLADPALQAYVNHVNKGLDKCDDFKPKPGQCLYRGFDSYPGVEKQYQQGNTLKEFAFTSTGTASECKTFGKWGATIQDGGKGKLVPFSAHPGEGEVLFRPGTQFHVDRNTPNTTPGLKPSPTNWDLSVV
jgi:hypothetical protein